MSDGIREKALKMRSEGNRAERRSAVIVWSIVGVLVAAFLGLIVWMVVSAAGSSGSAGEDLAKGEQLTPAGAGEYGSFVMPGSSGDAVVQVFFDPICPGCGYIEQSIGSELEEMATSGDFVLRYTPLNFLDATSSDDYSTRAANAWITVYENSPENIYDFMEAMMSEAQQPGEGSNYVSVSNDDLAALAESVGVSSEVASKFSDMSYVDWITSNTETVSADTELFPDGLSTPAVFVDGTRVEFNSDPLTDFEAVLNK